MIDPKADRGGSTAYVYLLTLVAALGGLLFGYDTAVISGARGYLTQHFKLNEWQEGWAVASILVGCMIGATLAGMLSDRFGRKKILLLSALLFALSSVGAAVPHSFDGFVAARLLAGFAVGTTSMLSPLYIAEVAPAAVRGRLVSLNQVAIVTGMVVVSVVNWLITSPQNELWNVAFGWRWMFASAAIPAAFFLAALFLVPESPRWLAKQGRSGEALAVLTRLGGSQQAQAEMKEIHEALAQESGSWGDLFRPGIRVALLIAVVLAVLQQLTGINAVLYYPTKIFESAMVTPTQALLQTIVVMGVMLAFTLLAIYVVDRAGRKPLLLTTSAAMGVSLLLLGGAFYFELPPLWIFAFTLAYVASFSVAMGPVVWVVLAEIFPTRTRGRAMSIATLMLWIADFALSQTVPWMFHHLGPTEHVGRAVTFSVYAVMCAVAFVFVILMVPETKGKTLEEIEQSWLRPS